MYINILKNVGISCKKLMPERHFHVFYPNTRTYCRNRITISALKIVTFKATFKISGLEFLLPRHIRNFFTKKQVTSIKNRQRFICVWLKVSCNCEYPISSSFIQNYRIKYSGQRFAGIILVLW